MSKEKTAPVPLPGKSASEPATGKGVLGAHLGRRYCPVTHQWLEGADAPAADSQLAPVGEKE